MSAAGLGRLANAIGSGSDASKSGTVHRSGDRASASGWIHVRGKSARTAGALEAFTEGADIKPRRGKYLWRSTDEIPRKVGRHRMTPELYRKGGYESRIGPLVFIHGRNRSEGLYIVRDVSVDRFGRRGRARRLPKRGVLAGSRQKKDFIVAFVGLRRATILAKFNPAAIIAAEVSRLPAVMAEEVRKETGS